MNFIIQISNNFVFHQQFVIYNEQLIMKVSLQRIFEDAEKEEEEEDENEEKTKKYPILKSEILFVKLTLFFKRK